MAKKSGRPDINNKGSKKKPDTGRAFLFGGKNSKADEFLSTEDFVLNKEPGTKESNNFLADEIGIDDSQKTEVKKTVAKDTKAETKNKAKDIETEQPEISLAVAKDVLEETKDKEAKSDNKYKSRKEKKKKTKQEEQLQEDSHTEDKAAVDDISKENEGKSKRSSRKAGREKIAVFDTSDDELLNEGEERQMEEPEPFFSTVKTIIEEEPKESLEKNRRGIGTARKEKTKTPVTEGSENTRAHSNPEKIKKTKSVKGTKAGKEKMPINPAEELEIIKKKQKKAVQRLNRMNRNTFGAVVTWLKSLLPEKGKDKKALKFAQTGIRKKSKKTKRIFIYSGAGILAVAIALVVIFVPFGKNADIQADGLEDADAIAVIDVAQTTLPTIAPTPIQTTQETENVVSTPIVTTEPDPTHQTIDIDDMVDDCMVEAKLYYNEVGYSNNYYEYTDNEIYILAQLIYGEARGESLDGMVAVGNVVMNRVLNRRYFGNSITAVVTASGQFSGYKSTIVPSSKCRIAARKVLDFQVWVVPQNVYYFKASGEAGIDWASHKFYTRIGGHNFYTHNYGGRSTSDKIPPRLYERTYKWPRFGCFPENRVYRIQYMLNKLGYNVTADKYFGAGTMKELKKFQEKKGLEADGVAGPSTVEALIRAFGIEEYYEKFYT